MSTVLVLVYSILMEGWGLFFGNGWEDIKVRDTIEEVNVNGFLMNNITFMPTIPQCV